MYDTTAISLWHVQYFALIQSLKSKLFVVNSLDISTKDVLICREFFYRIGEITDFFVDNQFFPNDAFVLVNLASKGALNVFFPKVLNISNMNTVQTLPKTWKSW